MRVVDDLEVVSVLCGLRERVSTWSLFEISEEICLRAARSLARVPEFRRLTLIPNVQAKRLTRDSDGIQIRRRVDPRSIRENGGSIVKR
jgi:hypothetical protein